MAVSLAQLGVEAYRLRLLTHLERDLEASGLRRIAGVDEVGRGSLAGPVVAAAVIPNPSALVPGVDDSKRLSAGQRETLAREIRRGAVATSVKAVPAAIIDRVNILQATRRAMFEALSALRPRPDVALIDAVALEPLPFPCLPLVRADCLSYAVACASILAKVERDRLMTELDDSYPGYDFAANKGYAAPAHLEALSRIGPCPDHRLTFRSVLPAVGTS